MSNQNPDAAAIYAQFEEACADFQVPATRAAAELVLSSFCQLPKALALCQYILDRAQSPMVQFQVAHAIGRIAVRDYSLYELSDIIQLKNYMIEYCAQRPTLQKYVREQLLLAISLITKRSMFDISEQDRMSIFLNIKQLFNSPGEGPVLGFAMANALVDQFSNTKSATVGLSWEFHYKCKVFFETRFLLSILEQAVTKLHHVVSQTNHLSSPPPALLVQCLELLEKILHWEFESTSASNALPGSFAKSGDDSDDFDREDGPSTVKKVFTIFPTSWQPVVGNSDVLWLFFRTYNLVQTDDVLSHRCRQCLVQLSGFQEYFFSHDSAAVKAYATTLMHGTLKMMNDILESGTNPEVLAEQGPHMLGAIQMTRRLLENIPVNILCTLPDFFQFLNAIGRLTVVCLRGTVTDVEEGWLSEASDECLETWVRLADVVQPGHGEQSLGTIPGMSKIDSENLSNYMKTVAYQVVETYIDARLESSILAMNDDEEEDEIDNGFKDWDVYADQLTCIGTLGRLHPHQCILRLQLLLGSCFDRLKTYFVNIVDSDGKLLLLHEQLHWIILITGHILADTGKGEQPMIPDSIMQLSGSQAMEQDPVVNVSRQLLELQRFSSSFGPNSMEASNCSPRVAATLVWFMERWSKSYLLVDENEYGYISPNIAKAFGRPGPSDGQGVHIIDFCIEQLKTNFVLWNADPDVLLQLISWLNACGTCVNTKSYLLQSNKFPDLVQFVTENMEQLPEVVHNCLIQTVASISSNSTDANTRDNYFGLIFKMIQKRLGNVLRHPNFQQNFQYAEFMNQVLDSLEMLDGLALACQFNNTLIIFDFCSGFFESLVQLMSLYKDVSQVQLLILQLFVDLAGRLDFGVLGQEQKQMFFRVVIEILRILGAVNQGKKRMHSQEEEEDKPYGDISAALILLSNIMASEFEDFNQNKNPVLPNQNEDVANVVLFGINVIIPMVDMEMLKIPNLCQEYIKLISHLIEVFPDKLTSLPIDLFNNLMASLEFGIGHDIADINILALHAVAPLALWAHVQQQSNHGNLGLLQQALSKFLGQLLKVLLFEHLDGQVVDAATEALLALICSQRDDYMVIVNQIIGQQPADIQSRLLFAFQTLDQATPTQLAYSLPPSRNAPGFREALLGFLMDVRAVLRVK
ncbi:armadillo-type protein [Phycomyces nitens]|nr:armadillo-type protein [Phycomyces nitens]